MSHFTDVRLWMATAGQRIGSRPDPFISVADHNLRIRLMKEELDETAKGMAEQDIVEIADGVADLLVVTYGTAVTYGINADAVFSEVMRANWTKFVDGKPVLDEGGKVLKGPNYVPPNVARVLQRGW